jgi:hypothetical protein
MYQKKGAKEVNEVAEKKKPSIKKQKRVIKKSIRKK